MTGLTGGREPLDLVLSYGLLSISRNFPLPLPTLHLSTPKDSYSNGGQHYPRKGVITA